MSINTEINPYAFKSIHEIEKIFSTLGKCAQQKGRFRWTKELGLTPEIPCCFRIFYIIQAIFRKIFGVSQSELSEYQQIDTAIKQLLIRGNSIALDLPGRLQNLEDFKNNAKLIRERITQIRAYHFPKTLESNSMEIWFPRPPVTRTTEEIQENKSDEFVDKNRSRIKSFEIFFRDYFGWKREPSSSDRRVGCFYSLLKANGKNFAQAQAAINAQLAAEHELFLSIRNMNGPGSSFLRFKAENQQAIRVGLFILTYAFSSDDFDSNPQDFSDEWAASFATEVIKQHVIELSNNNPVIHYYAKRLLEISNDELENMIKEKYMDIAEKLVKFMANDTKRYYLGTLEHSLLSILSIFFDKIPQIDKAVYEYRT